MSGFRNLSITLKISLSFFLLFIAISGFGVWAYQFSETVHADSAQILNESQPFAQLAEQMSRDTIQVQQWLTDISATRGLDGLNDGFAEAQKSYTSFMAGLGKFEEMFQQENNSESLKSVRAIGSKFSAYYETGKKMAQAYIDEGPAGGNKMMSGFDTAAENLHADLEPFLQSQTNEVRNALTGLQNDAEDLKSGIIAICLAVAVFATVIGFLLARSLSIPIRQGVALAEEIAKGDFSQRLNLERKDEIGTLANALDRMAASLAQNAAIAVQIAEGNLNVEVALASDKDQLGLALRGMINNLNDVLGQVQIAGEQIASGSYQVSDTSQSLSQGATESAASLEEISSSLNQLSAQTTTNAENATQANQLATSALSAAKNGGTQMESMVAAMHEINESGQSISKIIKTIDEIAFQTNLLALNAAVEAARAGQHGKGFAVVAEEVRNLAARSAKAAAETSELIEGSVQKTKNGSNIASQTSAALTQIFEGISKTSDLVAEIAAASNEQAQGVRQISLGVEQIDQVTQQNTASSEEGAAAAEELSSQAEAMRQMLARFTLKGQNRVPAVSWNKAAAAPKKKAVPKSGWEGMQGAAQQIALDDNEFGKY